MRNKKEEQIVQDLWAKYEDLVWYARSNPENWTNKKILDQVMKVEMNYPLETDLLCNDGGDWQHGFHSGCLAMIRLYEHYQGIEEGFKEFPFLDT